MPYHLQVKRKDGSVVMAHITSQRNTPKIKAHVECPLRNGRRVKGKVSMILPKAILAEDGNPVDLVEATEI